MTQSLEYLLSEGLNELGLAQADLREGLLTYAALLSKWNRVYNLTALRREADLARFYLLDCLTVLPYLQGPEILDVGTGGGTPGIPLALARPDLRFVLLDKSAKKTRFVRQVTIELGLRNVEVETARVEEYRYSAGFTTIVSRAFAALEDFVALTCHLLREDGIWLAMKGRFPQESAPGTSMTVWPTWVPGTKVKRHIVVLRRAGLPECAVSSRS